jgi:hypothetical protein
MPEGTSSTSPVEQSAGRLGWPLIAALIGLGLATQYFLTPDYLVGVYSDDACYLLVAWRMLGDCPICGQAIPHSPYAPGWPLVLAPFQTVFGAHVELYRLVSVGLTVASVILAARLFQTHGSKLSTFLFAATLFLSYGILANGSTLMSEPLYLFLAVLLVSLDSIAGWPARLLQAGLAGFAATVRPEGAVLSIALALSHACRRRWSQALATPLVAWLAYKAVMGTFLPQATPHASQVQDFFAAGVPKGQYLLAWGMNQALLMGRAFFFAPPTLARLFAFALLLLVVIQVWKARQVKDALPVLIVLGTLGALLFWPYLSWRYWLVTLPFWLLLSVGHLRDSRQQTAMLAILLAFQVGFLLPRPQDSASQESERELYSALTTCTDPDELVGAAYPGRIRLWGHRAWGRMEAAESLGIFARNQDALNTRVVVWERAAGQIKNMSGTTWVSPPANLALWLERSPLFETLFNNEAGIIARLIAPPGQLARAIESWNQANQLSDPRERLAQLDQARAVLDDVPEIRLVWALTALQLPEPTLDRGAQELQRYYTQYPHDFPSAPLAMQQLARAGQPGIAKEIGKRCLEEAQRLGDPIAIRSLQASLAGL